VLQFEISLLRQGAAYISCKCMSLISRQWSLSLIHFALICCNRLDLQQDSEEFADFIKEFDGATSAVLAYRFSRDALRTW
jgi:hypothetical protein